MTGIMFAGGVWIFYLESALALGLFVFIVWWTLPKQPKDKSGRSVDAGAPGAPDAPDAREKAEPSASDVSGNAGGENNK